MSEGQTFETKDSGERQVFASGMHRDTTKGKFRPDLVVGDGPMFERWVALMTRGAQKYEARNWMKADGEEELQRFRESALRHFIQWYMGDTDEDHGAATFFNINGAEYVKGRLAQKVNKSVEEMFEFLFNSEELQPPVPQIPVGTPVETIEKPSIKFETVFEDASAMLAAMGGLTPTNQPPVESAQRPVKVVWEHFHDAGEYIGWQETGTDRCAFEIVDESSVPASLSNRFRRVFR